MLLVVFGAGASFDSVDVGSHPGVNADYQPPLADHLFDPRFRRFVDMFPQLTGILDRVRGIKGGTTLEQVLENLQREADNYPIRGQQLAAARFYLQHVLFNCGATWSSGAGHATSYAYLFDRLGRWRHETGEEVALVTFNYDLMVEYALDRLFQKQFADLDDWINSPFPLYKLHGSVNWVHPVGLPNHSGAPTIREMIERCAELEVSAEQFLRIDNPGDLDSPGDVYPALAIPLLVKDVFECPLSHLSALDLQLTGVDRALVVGWRATEIHFLKRWRDAHRVDMRRMLLVAESEKAVGEMQANLDRGGIRLKGVRTFEHGFSALPGSDELDAFLYD